MKEKEKKTGKEFIYKTEYSNELPPIPFDPKLLSMSQSELFTFKKLDSKYTLTHSDLELGLKYC